MVKLNDKVRLKPEIYDNNAGLVEWLKHYMGESVDYYNIVWVVESKALGGGFVLRDVKWSLNASSFIPKEMIKVDNALQRLKERYGKAKV
jgi:hypothetical protein